MNNFPVILGINYGGHDTSACITVGGKLVAACEEERYNKEKHTREFPQNAISDCLKKANITINEVDEIALIYDPVFAIRETYLKTALEHEERIEFLINDIERIKQKYYIKNIIRQKTGFKGNISYHLHHLCHMASSYFVSGFDKALLLSHDGMGEIDCSLLGKGEDGKISILHEGNRYPNSLGLFYSAITHYLGWKHHSDEGIVMGLAPYGNDLQKVKQSNKTFREIFEEIIYEVGDYEFEIDRSWIAYYQIRDKWISEKFIETFGQKRQPNGPIEYHHKHVAAALQNRLETIVLNQLKRAKKQFGFNKLCLAGGVALNCSLNGKIIESKIFDEIFVQPASGDDGAAIGACFLASKKFLDKLKPIKWHNFYLGSCYTNNEIEKSLQKFKVEYSKPSDIFKLVANELANGKIIGWFQDSAEFGPRALGNRSILTSPYPKTMKDYLNKRVKFREDFRPFAPAILNEYTQDYFYINQESPHMLITTKVKENKFQEIPSVIHLDNSARIQTVTAENNPKFRKLLEAFYAKTRCPVLLNTSFNVKGQPIVNSPDDAIRCFLSTNIDVLAIGDFLTVKD